MKFYLLPLLAGILPTSCLQAPALTAALNHTNVLRTQSKAPNLNWDVNIEGRMLDWLNIRKASCTLAHPSTRLDQNAYLNYDLHMAGYSAFGQNLYMAGSTTLSPTISTASIAKHYKSAVNAWFKECWNYPSKNGTTGHYTQLVWASTRRMGCQHVFCQTPGSTMWWIIIGCNYEPAGNYMGQEATNVFKAC